MPRPKKCRKICRYPHTLAFAPIGKKSSGIVTLTVDEYEVLRLIDKEGMSQEQCGRQMKIARTTVQMIYASARRKLADVLVDGMVLEIGGGDYQICGGEPACCEKGECAKRRCGGAPCGAEQTE